MTTGRWVSNAGWGVAFVWAGLFATGCYDMVVLDGTDGADGAAEDPFYTVGDIPSSGYDGVDLLVVIDNSQSMAAEQRMLATGFFTLINAVTHPLSESTWPFSPLENMRVGVVTSDMGLQFGPNRELDDRAGPVLGCEISRGDDGAFPGTPNDVTSILVESGVIPCEPGGDQCPPDFSCINGRCSAPMELTSVNCVNPVQENGFAETTVEHPNSTFAVQTACMAHQGTEGCGIEQQLEAAVRGLETHPAFLVPSHVLAVLIVSDEEDCSIEDSELFLTDEWSKEAGAYLNVACNVLGNDVYLMSTKHYRARLSALKGDIYGTVFGAIVGVPIDPRCEGNGEALGACLSHPKMALTVYDYADDDGEPYKHFEPACTRVENGVELTSAAPGRRYVEVAQTFGKNGIVYSICNPNWGPALEQMVRTIASNFIPPCFHSSLPTDPGDDDGCEGCAMPDDSCQLYIEVPNLSGKPTVADCPLALYSTLNAEDVPVYLDLLHTTEVAGANGKTSTSLFCPVPKLSVPLRCSDAHEHAQEALSNRVGWYYCENDRGACGQEINLTNPGWNATFGYRRVVKCEK